MILFLVGLLAILCQIVLLRELNVACYGVELVYGLALAGWMIAGGAGAAWRFRDRVASAGHVAWLLVIVSLTLPVDIAFVRASRLLLGGVPGAFLPFGRQLLVLAVSLAPVSFLLGLAFRQAADSAARHGRSLAACYAVESAGAVVGATAATLALIFGVQTLALGILTAVLVAAFLLFTVIRKPVAGSACLVATLLIAPLVPDLDLAMTRWTHPSAVETRDSPYARITASVSGSQTAIFADDVLTFESESAQQEELADVAALQHPDPRRILLLGGSVERLALELERHHPDRIDRVEMDRVYYELSDRRLRLGPAPIFDDPRSFLRRANPYDLIVVATAEPTSGQSNRFYTAEFFGECRRRLAPGGVLAFRLALPENVITPVAGPQDGKHRGGRALDLPARRAPAGLERARLRLGRPAAVRARRPDHPLARPRPGDEARHASLPSIPVRERSPRGPGRRSGRPRSRRTPTPGRRATSSRRSTGWRSSIRTCSASTRRS